MLLLQVQPHNSQPKALLLGLLHIPHDHKSESAPQNNGFHDPSASANAPSPSRLLPGTRLPLLSTGASHSQPERAFVPSDGETATAAIGERSSRTESIGLFGIKKGLRKAEEAAEEIVRGGFEAADKGIETAERGIETAEKGIEAAERGIETVEKEIETVVSFDGLAQAGAVAGAEVLVVLVATSIVNGILGPEAQKS